MMNEEAKEKNVMQFIFFLFLRKIDSREIIFTVEKQI